jgi:hypothetical protein
MEKNQPEPPAPPDKPARRKELYHLLGRLPDRNRPISVKVVGRKTGGSLSWKSCC